MAEQNFKVDCDGTWENGKLCGECVLCMHKLDYLNNGLDDEDDIEPEKDFDCYMGVDGYCGAAGSNHCEFNCSNRQMAIEDPEIGLI